MFVYSFFYFLFFVLLGVGTPEILVAYKIFSCGGQAPDLMVFLIGAYLLPLEGGFPTTVSIGKSLFIYSCFHLYQYQLTGPFFFSLSNLCSVPLHVLSSAASEYGSFNPHRNPVKDDAIILIVPEGNCMTEM